MNATAPMNENGLTLAQWLAAARAPDLTVDEALAAWEAGEDPAEYAAQSMKAVLP